jgi:hypothetical protein
LSDATPDSAGGAAGQSDPGSDATAPDSDDARPCLPAKVIDGITAGYFDPMDATFIVVARDKQWLGAWTGAALTTARLLESTPYWSMAPRLDGFLPYEDAGVTAAYFDSTGTTFYAVSKDRQWAGPWSGTTFTTARSLRLAPEWTAAPKVGGAAPYEGAGVTAFYQDPTHTTFYVISKDKQWSGSWANNSFTTGILLKDNSYWANAPKVDGLLPYEGDGVTAAFLSPDGTQLIAVSGNRQWIGSWSGATFTTGRHLADVPYWANAPSIPCP